MESGTSTVDTPIKRQEIQLDATFLYYCNYEKEYRTREWIEVSVSF